MGIFKTIKYIFILLSIAIALSPFVILYNILFTDFFPDNLDINPIWIVIVGILIFTLPISTIWFFVIKRKIKKRRSGSNYSDNITGKANNIKTVKLLGGQTLAVYESSGNHGQIVYGNIENDLKQVNSGAWVNIGSLVGNINDFNKGTLEILIDGKKVTKIDNKLKKDGKSGKWYIIR